MIDLLLQGVGAGLLLGQVGEGVLDLLGGAQHHEAIGGQSLGLFALGGGDLGIDAAELEQPPAQAGADLAGLDGRGREQRARLSMLWPPSRPESETLG